jgi:membrane protein YqaA with SNARE-associated domain
MHLMGVLLAVGFWNWISRLGGIGLIVLGLADNSLVPLPGSVDALTIVLAASNKEWWWIYAITATIGAVIGGFLTFRLGLRGEEALEEKEKKLPKDKVRKVQSIFRKWGFGSVMIPAMLPPPVPIVPFLITAGAMRYPARKFLSALSLGRGVRYFVVAWLGKAYGKQIFGFFSKYYKPILISLIALAVIGAVVVLVLFLQRRKKRPGDVVKKAA